MITIKRAAQGVTQHWGGSAHLKVLPGRKQEICLEAMNDLIALSVDIIITDTKVRRNPSCLSVGLKKQGVG